MPREGGFKMGDGQWAALDNVTLAPSAARTSTAAIDGVEIGDKGTLRLDLVVTAASGTLPTLDVAVETSKESSGPWRAVSPAAFSQITGTGSQRVSFSGCDRWARAVFTIGGTDPSFTASVTGEAV